MTSGNSGLVDGIRRIPMRVRDLIVDGNQPGAQLGFRLRGSTLSGQPLTGTWRRGDVVVDQGGFFWVCTANGTPGTWRGTPGWAVAAASAQAAAVATSETLIISVNPGAIPAWVSGNASYGLRVRADIALVGATSVTSVTVKLHRSQALGGAALYTRSFNVAGAVNVGASAAVVDTAYDGTGYNIGLTAVGAACTADVMLEACVASVSAGPL